MDINVGISEMMFENIDHLRHRLEWRPIVNLRGSINGGDFLPPDRPSASHTSLPQQNFNLSFSKIILKCLFISLFN